MSNGDRQNEIEINFKGNDKSGMSLVTGLWQ